MEKELKLKKTQYIKESNGWLRALNELRIENTRLKDRLSEAISGNVSLDFVEQAEHFQQRFIESDQVVDLLRHDVNAFLYKLTEQKMKGVAEHQCVTLAKDIEQLIFEFNKMKISFMNFLVANEPG